MEEIKNRIKKIIERENIPSGVFADLIGVKQPTLSQMLNGRNRPSLEVVMKIHRKYNYVNLNWLLYGEGEMMASGKEPSSSDLQPSLFDENLENLNQASRVSENRKEIALKSGENSIKESVKQEIKYIEKPAKKISEIRVFFDDNTYETFHTEK